MKSRLSDKSSAVSTILCFDNCFIFLEHNDFYLCRTKQTLSLPNFSIMIFLQIFCQILHFVRLQTSLWQTGPHYLLCFDQILHFPHFQISFFNYDLSSDFLLDLALYVRLQTSLWKTGPPYLLCFDQKLHFPHFQTSLL